jgi:YD repeat-containing protein
MPSAWHLHVRLVEVKEGSNTVAKYAYDGASGRIVKVTYTGGSPSETRHYYLSSAWRVLEERVGSSTSPDRQYVWGLGYTNELMCLDRDTDGNGEVIGIIDTSGAAVVQYGHMP